MFLQQICGYNKVYCCNDVGGSFRCRRYYAIRQVLFSVTAMQITHSVTIMLVIVFFTAM